MMRENKVSIIVPVYNTAKYLEQCLESVVNQSLKDIEVICVNDGSTDNSLEILERYAQKDERIKIITQHNQGQSAARNKGLEIAQGRYIGFVDSDDWIDETMFEKLYQNAKSYDSDVAMCSISMFSEKTGECSTNDPYMTIDLFPKSFENRAFTPQETFGFIFRICVSPCNKIYNRTFLEKNNIRFFEGLFWEDNVFFLKMFLSSKKISLIRECAYFYRKFSSTSTCTGDDYKKLDFFEIYNLKEQILREKNLLPQNKNLTKYFYEAKKNTLLYWYKKLSDERIKAKYQERFYGIYKEDIEEQFNG